MQLSRQNVETLKDFAQHSGFKLFYAVCMKPEIDRWRTRLLTEVNLSEPERKGYVLALRAIKEGIELAYTNSGLNVPLWVQEEFGVNE